MEAAQLALLHRHLAETYVGGLPPLLHPSASPDDDSRKNLSRSLSAFTIKHVCGASVADACASVVDDFGDLGIDAVYYHSMAKTLFIVQSKLKSSQDFSQDEANAFCQGVRKLVASDYSGFNQNVLDRQIEIDSALDDCEAIQLIVSHTGNGLRRFPQQAIADLIADDSHGEERFVDPVLDFSAQQIIDALRGVHAHERIDCRLNLSDWAKLGGGRTAYIGMVSLEELARLHQRYGPALYARNIRSSLGQATDVNRALDESLASNPGDFEFFNNGITALCSSIQGRRGNRDRKTFEVQKLSIVNGAQTVAAAARRAAAAGDGSISAARVLATIIAADTENEFGQSVTRARNHQNVVGKADFVALDPEQERLRRELALIGYRYAYQAEWLDLADATIIRVEEAAFALAMLQPDPRLPVMAKRNAASLQRVGSYPYSTLFKPALSAFTLRNAVLAYRYITTRMNEEARAAGSPQEKLAYRHGSLVAGFVMMKRLLAEIDKEAAISPDRLAVAVGPELDQLREALWTQVQPLSVNRSPLSVFKTQANVSDITRVLMVDHYGLAGDGALPSLLSLDASDQPYPERLFGYISTRAPQIENLS